MRYHNLGASGLQISRFGLGCMGFGTPAWRPWVLGEAESRPIIQRALEIGINFFDTADIYSGGESEAILGRAIAEMARREEVVIATKVYFPVRDGPNGGGLSRRHIMASIDASLQRLGTDHVDLYQVHRFDPLTPLEETLDALDDVVRAGKARYLGASSMWAWQLMKALMLQRHHGWAPFISMQDQLNLVYREEEREMLPLCRSEGLGLLPWSPLARGLLAGSRVGGTRRAATDAQMAQWYDDSVDGPVVQAAATLAAARGTTLAAISLAWLLATPGVTTPIVGATRLEHLDAAVTALDLILEPTEVTALESPYRPHAIVGQA